MALDHQHQEFKKHIGTRAHEARVPFSHVSPLPTLKPYVTHNTRKEKSKDETHKDETHKTVPTLSPYHPHPYQNTFKPSHPHTLTPSTVEDSRLHSIAVWGYRGFTPSPSLRSTVLSFSLSLSLSLSLSPSLNAIVWMVLQDMDRLHKWFYRIWIGWRVKVLKEPYANLLNL